MNTKRTVEIVAVLFCMAFMAACQKAETTEPTLPKDTRGIDSTEVDGLPPGYVQIGDIIVNTNWEGETHINF